MAKASLSYKSCRGRLPVCAMSGSPFLRGTIQATSRALPRLLAASQVLLFQEYAGRSMGLSDGIGLNYRPTQPLNGREVTYFAT